MSFVHVPCLLISLCSVCLGVASRARLLVSPLWSPCAALRFSSRFSVLFDICKNIHPIEKNLARDFFIVHRPRMNILARCSSASAICPRKVPYHPKILLGAILCAVFWPCQAQVQTVQAASQKFLYPRSVATMQAKLQQPQQPTAKTSSFNYLAALALALGNEGSLPNGCMTVEHHCIVAMTNPCFAQLPITIPVSNYMLPMHALLKSNSSELWFYSCAINMVSLSNSYCKTLPMFHPLTRTFYQYPDYGMRTVSRQSSERLATLNLTLGPSLLCLETVHHTTWKRIWSLQMLCSMDSAIEAMLSYTIRL